MGVSFRCLDWRARTRQTQMNVKHLILPESKEIFKEWRYIMTDKGAAKRVFPNVRTFYKIFAHIFIYI